VDQRKILRGEIVTGDAVEVCAEAVGEILRSLRQFFRPHIVGWRVDQIAR
jgi:hypothetical protein